MTDVDDILGGETPGAGHNSGETAYRVSANELRQFVERIERLESEKRDILDHIKEVKAEAKARGYDVKVLGKIISERKRDRAEVSEEEAVLQLYREVLGMA